MGNVEGERGRGGEEGRRNRQGDTQKRGVEERESGGAKKVIPYSKTQISVPVVRERCQYLLNVKSIFKY